MRVNVNGRSVEATEGETLLHVLRRLGMAPPALCDDPRLRPIGECRMCSVEIVGEALLICGISGYRNDSKFSLARHLRDAYGCALMVNNDRITKLNATMLLAHKEG